MTTAHLWLSLGSLVAGLALYLPVTREPLIDSRFFWPGLCIAVYLIAFGSGLLIDTLI